MKKILVVLLALAMTLTLVACGGGKDDETTKAPEGTKTPAATTAAPTPAATTAAPTPEATTAEPTPEATTAEPTPEATTAEPTPEATTAEPTPEATTAPEAAVTTEEPGKVTEGDATPEATEPEATPVVTEPEATPAVTEPETTPDDTLPEAPEGYTYHTIEGIGFVCPSTWQKTTSQGQTLYADMSTGANIVVVATAKTDRYENLTVEGFRAEVGIAYEQMGATIKSIEYGPATVAGDLAVMRGYIEVSLQGTIMTQEMFVVSSETHTYAVNLSFVPTFTPDAAAITEVVANSIVVLH